MRKKKGLKILTFVGLLVFYLLKWLLVDLFKTIAKAIKHTKYPEERRKINRTMAVEKKVEIHDERIKRVERLIYSVYEDPEYSKSDKGKHDIKKLKESVK